MVLDTPNPPIIINGAHTLVGCLTALAFVRQFNQKVVLVSVHSEALLINEAILVDSESATKLCTLLETPFLQKVVQCRNVDGYFVHDLERGDCLIEFDSHSLYKAVMSKLTMKYHDMVQIIFGIREPSVHFQVIPQVSNQMKVPILKYVNKEDMAVEIISKFLLDCERKSFVVQSMLHHSSSGLNLKQSSSSYMYQQLDIPSKLYPFKESKLQIRIQDNTTLMIVPKFLSDEYSTTFFFKVDPQLQYDQNMVALKMLEFLKNEFPFTFSLTSIENIYSWLSSHLETIQDYQVTASATECIGFLNQSRIPHFGQYQFTEVFQIIKNLESLGIPNIKQIPAEDIKTSIAKVELEPFSSVKAIERKLNDYRVMKNTMARFGPVWNFLKIPVIAIKQHVIDVFGGSTSRMTTAQKWRYRFIYGLSAILLYKGASNWYRDRMVANDIIQKIGTENELCKKLIRKCVSGDCGSKTVSLMVRYDEGLNFLEISTLVNLLKDVDSRIEFLTHLISSGNIKELSTLQVSSLLSSIGLFKESEKLDLVLKLHPYVNDITKQGVSSIASHFTFANDRDRVYQLFQSQEANPSSGRSGTLAFAVLTVFFLLGML